MPTYNNLHSGEAGDSVRFDVTTHPAFQNLNRTDQHAARIAQAVIQLFAREGWLDLNATRRILDFGAGSGGPTLALVAMAESNGGSVEAVEQEQTSHLIAARGIVAADRLHTGDGLAFLGATEQVGRFNLITAFMLGPDPEGRLSDELLTAARLALVPGGQLLMTSDIQTVPAFQEACRQQGIGYNVTPLSFTEEVGSLPQAVLISF